ncbi:MAG: alginate lyase family protein [Armatimonadota bacterium]
MNKRFLAYVCVQSGIMMNIAAGVQVTKLETSAPNLLLTAGRITYIQRELRAGNPVISEAYQQLIGNAEASMALSPDPIVGEVRVPGFYTSKREEHRAVVRRIRKDSNAANCLALAYAISKERKYADKSKEYLYAWVHKLGQPRDGGTWLDALTLSKKGDTPLVITYTFPSFMFAFDILQGLGQLTDSEVDEFRQWLRVYVNYCSHERMFKNNHYNWQALFMLCAGHVLQDNDVFTTGMRYFKKSIDYQILGDGSLALEMWREDKCGTYTLMALEAMVQGAHIAVVHGHPEVLTTRSRYGASMKDAVDCLVSFLDDPDHWQTNRRRFYVGYTKQNRPDDNSNWGWLQELPHVWWPDAKYPAYMQKRPYGLGDRAYTLNYSTLLFAR